MVDNPHGKGVTFTIRSRPVGYAAEYLTRGTFSAIPMGSFPLMFIYCILYHFWDVRRILLPPPRQFYRAHASLYQPTTQSPSFHQPRHTIHFSILSILLILSKTSTHSTQSTRPSSSLFVYLVYFVVQFFAFFAANHSPLERTPGLYR